MDSQQFAYWLKGYFEISDSNNLSSTQVQIIRDHLDLVFKKVTPDRMGYELLDTKFTGVSSNYLCGLDKIFKPKFQFPEPETYC